MPYIFIDTDREAPRSGLSMKVKHLCLCSLEITSLLHFRSTAGAVRKTHVDAHERWMDVCVRALVENTHYHTECVCVCGGKW